MAEPAQDRPRIGAGERSARQILAAAAALLIVVVLAVHIAMVTRPDQPSFPLWALALGWLAAVFTIATGVAARWLPDAALRTAALIAVAAYGLTLITFPFAVPDQGIDRIPWTLTASGAAAAAALVGGGRRLAWLTVLAGTTAGFGFRAVYGGLDLTGVVNDLQALLTGAVICVIGGHIISVGRGLDAAAASISAAAARESAERGRLAARTRAAALVHDEVLATLNLAASDLPIPRDRLAEQAGRAASALSRMVDEQAEEPVLLRRALAEEARRHGAAFAVLGGPVTVLPAATQEALLGATRQALLNSRQHAPGANVEVTLEIRHQEATGSAILVRIADDGPGFDLDGIADDRLGIRQSIVGRMSRVNGGAAEVCSQPGGGTEVMLRCAAELVRVLDSSGDRRALRSGLGAVAVVYVLTQTACAVLASLAVAGTWPLNLAVLATALLAAEILRRTPSRRPGPGRTAPVVALVLGGLVAGALTLPFGYGTTWFSVAFAFVFVAFALRGRIGVAVTGGAMIVAVLVVTGLAAGVSAGELVQVTVRPVVLITLAAALLMVAERLHRRIAALHHEAVDQAERRSWTLAARSELAIRVAELGRTVVPLLERIAAGGDPTPAERREYASWEGELRDSLRAGSLARDPLVGVVAAARDRGVDVVLLDDSGGSLADAQVEPVLRWMADAIAGARERAVGRLLPAGREAVAGVTVDGQHTEFQGAANIVQGE
ncbi:hypothetical protein [Herbiconiux sp.]|uniref:sensor histidine kinase n=1 Tax=Herbiconiux sp. TaxID=1871186 RepID=UPI0025BE0219|nr:hypothetical protein [Herbiconiux sp.]